MIWLTGRHSRNAMDVESADTRFVIVRREDVKLAENQPIDDMNVVQEFLSHPSIRFSSLTVVSFGILEML